MLPPVAAANVISSAEVVIVTLLPATNVSVSSSASATTSVWPLTSMVLKLYSLASPPDEPGAAAHTALPPEFLVSTWSVVAPLD